VGNSIQLLDPQTLQICNIPSSIYWRVTFDSLASVTDLVEFTVLHIDMDRTRQKSRHVMADAQVALAGAFHSSGGNNGVVDDGMMDFELSGVTNQIFLTRTHLGSIL